MTEEEKRKMVEDIINGDREKLPEDWTDEERQEVIRRSARKILERIGYERK